MGWGGVGDSANMFLTPCRVLKIEKGSNWGKRIFMRASEVGTDLKTTVEVELKWEDISGGVMEKDQVNSKKLVQVEERLGGKLEQMSRG